MISKTANEDSHTEVCGAQTLDFPRDRACEPLEGGSTEIEAKTRDQGSETLTDFFGFSVLVP